MMSTDNSAVEKIVEILTPPMEFYNSKRKEGEMDLVSIVRERLIEHGLKDKIENYDNNRFIQEAKDKPAHAQQYNLNRYFTMQFMAAKENADVERYSLIYEIKPDQWLTIFDKTILPAVVDYNLPVEI